MTYICQNPQIFCFKINIILIEKVIIYIYEVQYDVYICVYTHTHIQCGVIKTGKLTSHVIFCRMKYLKFTPLAILRCAVCYYYGHPAVKQISRLIPPV